jgi:two-component system response regulator FixJ
MSGLDVQTQLLKMRTDLAVIVVTGQGDIQTAVRAMKAGAADFLEKPYSDHALLGSIEMGLRQRLLTGRPNKLIAYNLGISVRTVEVHRARMMERLGVRQLAEVIRLGVIARLSTSLPDNKRRG